MANSPARTTCVVRASAPTRICDNGGWTDTWFAVHGKVFSIAIEPRVFVELHAFVDDGLRPPLVVDARVFGDRYEPPPAGSDSWGPHPLLEATIAEVGVPDGLAIEAIIDSEAPYGASIGTSAATCVALIGALDALTPGRMTPAEVARAAWRVETERLGQQCGIQDQLAAAFGGINLIEMHTYPDSTVERVVVEPSVLAELERRLVVVYLGSPHSSSAIHEKVIADMESLGPTAPPIQALRRTAEPSRNSLIIGDFDGLGAAMIANTVAQQALHADLVSTAAQSVIDVGRHHGVIGYKVNGAGGAGGSLTLLTDGDPERRATLTTTVEFLDPVLRVLPVRLSRDGLRVEVTAADWASPQRSGPGRIGRRARDDFRSDPSSS